MRGGGDLKLPCTKTAILLAYIFFDELGANPGDFRGGLVGEAGQAD